jgi:hypothetical protein
VGSSNSNFRQKSAPDRDRPGAAISGVTTKCAARSFHNFRHFSVHTWHPRGPFRSHFFKKLFKSTRQSYQHKFGFLCAGVSPIMPVTLHSRWHLRESVDCRIRFQKHRVGCSGQYSPCPATLCVTRLAKLRVSELAFPLKALSNAVTGCAVKRWWSTAGVKPARELVRSTR